MSTNSAASVSKHYFVLDVKTTSPNRSCLLNSNLPREQYAPRKKDLESELVSLVLPDVDAAHEAGRLLEKMPTLWKEAGLAERRQLLTAMSDEVHVDPVEERRIVALKPKLAFKALFQIATTKEGSDIILYNEKALALSEDSDGSCSWWRRGGSNCTVLHF